ncbi:uncharacterized protein SCODWIG_01442 [Saccharomycodes ludwigii]|uniref:Maintenance of telomere capping protein 1 n=1 Tax=Saccharomycodes ludwigii TaxID=36035 RepID=A0A376B4W4_9ASCO|nr:hypothetical protein SCDLUD_002439 [Saccharomycodes ludwigii]KAH3900976.1 hypothetical protein SCDLUD_002439 [Saccharomycodes ludwigii]SSD59681.1 uncharacterized protein SCODWIG_01442 [Saccharomycodes ludwigii]
MSSKTTDADDVLQFLESLPEQKSTTTTKYNNNNDDKDDILDFLDELDQNNNNTNNSNKSSTLVSSEKETEPFTPVDQKKITLDEKNISDKEKVSEQPKVKQSDSTSNSKKQEEQVDVNTKEQSPINDPITSFASWWNNSGTSAKFNNLLKTTTQTIQETLEENKQVSSAVSGLAKNLTKLVVGETSEVLKIHINHDIQNWRFTEVVDESFYQILSAQVQDGVRIFVDEPRFNEQPSVPDNIIDFQFFQGKVNDGEKLCLANLEASIKKHVGDKKKGDSESNTPNTTGENDLADEDNEDYYKNVSEVFISILPTAVPVTKADDEDFDNEMTVVDSNSSGNFSITMILKDITNDITILVRSQGFPLKWAEWITNDESYNRKKDSNEEKIDIGEWVRDWIEDGIQLTVRTLAQNYVLKRIKI